MTQYAKQHDNLMHIVNRAIDAVSPAPAMRAALKLDGDVLTVSGRPYDLSVFDRILVIGAGKASASMGQTLEELLGDRIEKGVVATKYGHGLPLKKIKVMESAHPVPDAAGELASGSLLKLADEAGENDLVFCLLSGGASAIIPAPCAPVTLADKQETTRALLECGATINEINAVRKHLSSCKGGHLAKQLEPATVVTLIISDVVGDYLDVIGSGPTAPDESTFQACLDTVNKHSLCQKAPDAVVKFLEEGAAGKLPETLKAEDSCFDKVQNVIIAGNGMALSGAAEAARELGYNPVVIDPAMEGEARDVAKSLVRSAEHICGDEGPTVTPACLLAGGETTVTITGTGRGGRNQELALAAAIELAKVESNRERIAVACVGTDGTDGPTDAAGALVLPDTLKIAENQGLDPARYLAENDSYDFFSKVGTILKTGPTRTNVMDVTILLVEAD